MTYPLSHFIKLPELQLPSEIIKVKPFSLSEVHLDPHTLTTFPDIILGKQAEFLFSETIKASTNYSLLQHNIQVNVDKRTIGELDYIIQEETSKKMIHVELACKFYLLKEEEHEQLEGQWIGPNLKDTLLDKINKFKDHQFPLLYHSATKEILEIIPISEVFKQHYCIKAHLFVPENYTKELPVHYNDCVVGVWKKHSTLILNKDAQYAIPPKRTWLLPSSQIKNWYSSSAISALIEEQLSDKKSVLLYEQIDNSITVSFVVWW